MNNTDIAVNLVEIQYIEKMKAKMSLDDDVFSLALRDRLFPTEWCDMDGVTKLRALKEALDDSILLSDTVTFQKYFNETCEENNELIRLLLINYICGDNDDE